MFWSAVLDGLAMLRHWQVWLAAVLIATVALAFALPAAGRRSGPGLPRAGGCLSLLAGGLLVRPVLTSLYFAFLLPIALGGDRVTPVSLVAEHAGRIALAGFIAALVGFFVGALPFLPNIIAETLATFVQGVVLCRMLLDPSFGAGLGRPGVTVALPGFWTAVAFLAVALVLCLAPAALGCLTRRTDAGPEKESGPPRVTAWAAWYVSLVLGVVAGALPVFMYVRYAT